MRYGFDGASCRSQAGCLSLSWQPRRSVSSRRRFRSGRGELPGGNPDLAGLPRGPAWTRHCLDFAQTARRGRCTSASRRRATTELRRRDQQPGDCSPRAGPDPGSPGAVPTRRRRRAIVRAGPDESGPGPPDLEKKEEALAHCQEAVRLDPSSAEIHDNLGNVLRALDRLDEAWTAYWEALRLNPELPLANAHVGLLLQKKGHFAEALPWLRKAVDLEPTTAAIWEWLADLHGEMDEPAAAIPCWERVLALEPDRSAARLSLGRALQDEGRLAEAREQYRIADRRMPHSGPPQLNLGWLHELLGEMDEAESAFRQALDSTAKLPRASRQAGDLAARQATPGRLRCARSPPGRRALAQAPAPGCCSAWPMSWTRAANMHAPPFV